MAVAEVLAVKVVKEKANAVFVLAKVNADDSVWVHIKEYAKEKEKASVKARKEKGKVNLIPWATMIALQ